jgi:hypothetical protein
MSTEAATRRQVSDAPGGEDGEEDLQVKDDVEDVEAEEEEEGGSGSGNGNESLPVGRGSLPVGSGRGLPPRNDQRRNAAPSDHHAGGLPWLLDIHADAPVVTVPRGTGQSDALEVR